jgi:hypothetical protein
MAASDILIEIYMAESTILRTEKLPKKVKTKYRNKSRWQTKFVPSCYVVTQKRKLYPFAEGDERMMLMGLRRFTKIYQYAKYCS